MTNRRDFHIQVDVRDVAGENFQQRMIESWATALQSLNIPFLIPAALIQTIQPPEQEVFHRMTYGVCGESIPHARSIRKAVCESLAIHDFPSARVDVVIYVTSRQVISSDPDTRVFTPSGYSYA